MSILVRGKRAQTRINDMLVVDYVEPDPPFQADPKFQRVLNHGTFALQGHDPGSTTHFKNIRVRPLPDTSGPLSAERPQSTISIGRLSASAPRTIPWSTTTCT